METGSMLLVRLQFVGRRAWRAVVLRVVPVLAGLAVAMPDSRAAAPGPGLNVLFNAVDDMRPDLGAN